ncbi:uncharacterized protein BDZ99DRAFT_155403 [Mytilinidion resinicola]|uniref:2EXR domain-containing protein n=1 Tax=Mytilinidion resinicola TaxID=574789 RepID=A0A6A6Y739_9PEZI|nr:uncharacterized protein BDZ99DRAFT_155403 [Mytilinidion resinicola]KAF2804348.1 hypothetical protein BDZ99DRAFT_155403 [Mytilinidion resinicola]
MVEDASALEFKSRHGDPFASQDAPSSSTDNTSSNPANDNKPKPDIYTRTDTSTTLPCPTFLPSLITTPLPGFEKKRKIKLEVPIGYQTSASATPWTNAAPGPELLLALNVLSNAASGSPSGSCFPQLGNLPAELRLMVWTFAAFIPRRLNITHEQEPRNDGSCAAPALLAVCREARDVALKCYGWCYLTVLKGEKLTSKVRWAIRSFDDYLRLVDERQAEPSYAVVLVNPYADYFVSGETDTRVLGWRGSKNRIECTLRAWCVTEPAVFPTMWREREKFIFERKEKGGNMICLKHWMYGEGHQVPSRMEDWERCNYRITGVHSVEECLSKREKVVRWTDDELYST